MEKGKEKGKEMGKRNQDNVKMENKIGKELLIYLLASFVILYLIISFILWNGNVSEWHSLTRMAFIMIYGTTTYFGAKRLMENDT